MCDGGYEHGGAAKRGNVGGGHALPRVGRTGGVCGEIRHGHINRRNMQVHQPVRP
jgi:hypothetical protein